MVDTLRDWRAWLALAVVCAVSTPALSQTAVSDEAGASHRAVSSGRDVRCSEPHTRAEAEPTRWAGRSSSRTGPARAATSVTRSRRKPRPTATRCSSATTPRWSSIRFLYKRLGFDPLNDFAPISVVAKSGPVLVVHPSVPARNAKELIALAKARPGQLNFGSGGRGTPAHYVGEMLKSAAGIKIVHVPYKGGILAVLDLVAGQLDLMFADMAPAVPQIKASKLRALAVTSEERSPALPEVPTMVEAGIWRASPQTWWALVAPRAPRRHHRAPEFRSGADHEAARRARALRDPRRQPRAHHPGAGDDHGPRRIAAARESAEGGRGGAGIGQRRE